MKLFEDTHQIIKTIWKPRAYSLVRKLFLANAFYSAAFPFCILDLWVVLLTSRKNFCINFDFLLVYNLLQLTKPWYEKTDGQCPSVGPWTVVYPLSRVGSSCTGCCEMSRIKLAHHIRLFFCILDSGLLLWILIFSSGRNNLFLYYF